MLHCERRGSCTPQPWLGSKGGASAPHGPWGQRQPPSCANVPRVRCASAASRCRKTKRAREPRANRCRQADRAQAVLRRTGRHRRRGRKRAGFPPPVVKPGAEGRRNPRCSHGPLSLLRRGVSSGAGTRRGALAARGETAASPSEPGQALTLAPIWLPHWPACRCTISLMVVVVAAAAAAAARQLHVASLLRLSSSSPPPFPPPPPGCLQWCPAGKGGAGASHCAWALPSPTRRALLPAAPASPRELGESPELACPVGRKENFAHAPKSSRRLPSAVRERNSPTTDPRGMDFVCCLLGVFQTSRELVVQFTE